MAEKLITVKKYDADIYPNESFFIDIQRDDGAVFEDTNTFEVEIRDSLGTTIDSEEMFKSVAKTEFEVRYLNTSSWTVGKEYKLLGRLKDSVSLYNDVVLEVAFTVK